MLPEMSDITRSARLNSKSLAIEQTGIKQAHINLPCYTRVLWNSFPEELIIYIKVLNFFHSLLLTRN